MPEPASPKLEPPPRVDIPEEPPIDPGTTHSSPRGKGFGGNNNLLQTAIICLVVTLAVIMIMSMMGGMVFVTKSDFTKNLSGMASSIDQVAKKLVSDNNTAAEIPGLISTQLASATKELNGQITSINTKIADHATRIADSATKVTDAQTKASDAQTKANDAQSKASDGQSKANDALSKITSLTTDVNTKITTIYSLMTDYDTRLKKLEAAKPPTVDLTEVNAKLNALAITITDYEARIKKLEATPTPTTTTTTTPTPTPTVTPVGTVTASIVPNAFGNNTFMSFDPVTANSTATRTFTVEIVNNTGKTINNVQLAVGLAIYDNNMGEYSLPVEITTSLSSGGNPSIIWDLQNTGGRTMLVYVNQVNTGPFPFGKLSQSEQSKRYTQSFTLKGGNTLGTPPIMIVPAVSIMDYD